MYDVILANPPFKGSIDKSDINERFKVKTTKTELLFLELMYDMLVPGGRCAVIVPDGVLFGSSNAHKEIRKLLIEKCNLEGVISMPSGVFKPYAGVSTAVIIFQKGGTTDKVWFYDMQADGYSLDDKRDKVAANDIPDIIEQWNVHVKRQTSDVKRRNDSVVKEEKNDRTGKYFFVPVEEIKENGYDLSINRYKESVYEEVKYEEPSVILEKIKKIESDILKQLEELEKEL